MPTEKRRSYRYAVQEEFASATVQSGRKEWPATLINESAGGFLFTAPRETGFQPGSTLTLSIYSGSYLVEVVHTRIENDRLYVGVRRFDDEIQPYRGRSATSRWLGRICRKSPWSSQTVLFLGAYVSIAVLGGLWLWGDEAEQLAVPFVGGSGSLETSVSAVKLPTDLVAPLDWRAAHRLHGINSLTSEPIRNAIGLTGAQQRSLDVIFSDTAQRLQRLYGEQPERDGTEWDERSSRIVDEAVQRVLCTLTDRQIERWRKELIGAASPAPTNESQRPPRSGRE